MGNFAAPAPPKNKISTQNLNGSKGHKRPISPEKMGHSPQVEEISGGGSDMILPFNFKKITTSPRPQENEMRPL
jgi:hypothetical protein